MRRWWSGSNPTASDEAMLVRLAEEDGGYDGVVGFSQGAAAAGLLASLSSEARRGEGGDKSPLERIKFAILAGGYATPRTVSLGRVRGVHTIHCIGKGDEAVPPAASEELALAPLSLPMHRLQTTPAPSSCISPSSFYLIQFLSIL